MVSFSRHVALGTYVKALLNNKISEFQTKTHFKNIIAYCIVVYGNVTGSTRRVAGKKPVPHSNSFEFEYVRDCHWLTINHYKFRISNVTTVSISICNEQRNPGATFFLLELVISFLKHNLNYINYITYLYYDNKIWLRFLQKNIQGCQYVYLSCRKYLSIQGCDQI